MQTHFRKKVAIASSGEQRAVAREQLSNLSQYTLPINDPLFDEGSFTTCGLIKPKGHKDPKKTAKMLVDTAKLLTYIDTDVIGISPTESIVIKAETHATLALQDRADEIATASSEASSSQLFDDIHDILPTTVVSVNDKQNAKSHDVSTSFTVARQIVDLLVEKNASGVVAVWGDVTKDAIRVDFPNATFASSSSSVKSAISVFTVRASTETSKGVLQPVTNGYSDFDGVVSAAGQPITRKTFENTRFFCIGYGMFTGAITLTTTVPPEAGSERPPLLVCPKTCIYAHSPRRSIDSTCQIIGRSCNDIPYNTDYKLVLLSHVKTLDQAKAYMRAEHRLLSTMSEPWLNPITHHTERDDEGYFRRPSLYACLVKVSKELKECGCYDGSGGLGAASLGMKKNTLKTAVSDQYNASMCTSELAALSDDEEVEENKDADDAQLAPLPESKRFDGVPYLFCCAIAWFSGKIPSARKKANGALLLDKTIKEYRADIKKIFTHKDFYGHPGGWKAIFPESPPTTTKEKEEFREVVLRPVVEALGDKEGNSFTTDEALDKEMKNKSAPFWKFYTLFPNGSSVRDATPEDFGFASQGAAGPSGPSVAGPMDTDDGDYTP